MTPLPRLIVFLLSFSVGMFLFAIAWKVAAQEPTSWLFVAQAFIAGMCASGLVVNSILKWVAAAERAAATVGRSRT